MLAAHSAATACLAEAAAGVGKRGKDLRMLRSEAKDWEQTVAEMWSDRMRVKLLGVL